jgi:glycosyltransferase involved in cell wall biosynthesis
MTDVTVVAHDVGSVGGMELVLAELIVGPGKARTPRNGDISRVCAPTDGRCNVSPRARDGASLPARLSLVHAHGLAPLARRRRRIVHVTGAIVLNPVDVIAVPYRQHGGPRHPSRSNLCFVHSRVVELLACAGERLRFNINRRSRLVCVSRGVAGEVRTHYPALAPRVMTIHNGVDTETFTPEARREEAPSWRARLGIAQDALVAAFIGSERTRKGLDLAIEALAEAAGWVLIVAGSGDEHHRELARSLGKANAVRFLGPHGTFSASMSSPTPSCCPPAMRRSRLSPLRPRRAAYRSWPPTQRRQRADRGRRERLHVYP